MRKNTSLIVLLLIIFNFVVMAREAAAVEPLKFVTIRFVDGSTLNCRVGAEEGTLLTPDAPDQVLSCEEGYDLSQIVWIRVNARQVGLNPYLGLNQFVPADINQVMVPDGQIGG